MVLLHHHHHLLLLLLSITATTTSLKCPPCGTTPVPYPLSTNPTCGDPLYTILCNPSNSSLLFPALNTSITYPITSVHPEIQRLVIRPSPLLPDLCISSDLPDQGLQLNSSLPFNVTSSNTIFFLNCTQTLLLSPLNCSAISPCHAYASSKCAARGSICCSFVAGGSSTLYSVRASVSGCSAYTSFVDLDVGSSVSGWAAKEGVELMWASPREPRCKAQSDCEDGKNATCRADVAGGGERRCFCNAGLQWNPINGTCAPVVTGCQDPGGCNHSSNRAPLIAGLASGMGAAMLVIVVGALAYRKQRRARQVREALLRAREEILNANNSGSVFTKNFTGREIKKATDGFSRDNLLGTGGFGEVLNEVRILSQVNHRNLVRLLGCCVELEQPLMVYEFISNGTLFEHLHGKRGSAPLSWRRRLAIAHQTAEGLAYLHFSAKAIDFTRGTDDVNLVVYVQRMVDKEKMMEVVDPGLREGVSQVVLDTMKALGFLAMGCLEERRQNRPSMKDVTEEIEYIMSIEAAVVEQYSSL
ncbi:Wall-associated receptor kinase-like 20 [Acorus calamus]|uniref:Wall-associated receptor kinase-like 20 n=1 Tax=Acorus calamus TaxID=4465 RepID=A0AAV9DDP6_ACOCL|nr:Wall-associated receptor kinase-like 20 [Acorus calamus]